MSPLSGPTDELDEKHEELIVKLVAEIRNGTLEGSDKIALAAITLFETIISEAKTATAFELISSVKSSGVRLSRALPQHPVLANMTRRVLKAIRTENRLLNDRESSSFGGESLQRLVCGAPARRATLSHPGTSLQEPLREHTAELRLEIEGSWSSICSGAGSHIHAAETILAARAVPPAFLLQAKQRRPHVVLTSQCQAEAAKLSAGGVPVTMVDDSAVYAVMSRVNKVILSACAVLAGGGALCAAGSRNISTAAKHCSVPVIVLAPLYVLSPQHAAAPSSLTSLQRPVPNYQSVDWSSCDTVSPQLDYIPADHITLYITNQGGSSPSYIYRLLSELYETTDYEL